MGDLNIYQKLLNVQVKLKAPKNQYNQFGKYSYRSLEDICEAVKPLLYENGLTLTLSDKPVAVGDRIYIKATAVLTDESNSQVKAVAYAREAASRKGMDESQVSGAASSYARKYCLNGLFLIDDTKDADATHGKSRQSNLMTKAQIQKIKDLTVDLIPKAGPKEVKKVAEILGISSKTTTSEEFEQIWKAAIDDKFNTVIEGMGLK